jgi:RHS repeat-associated protein
MNQDWLGAAVTTTRTMYNDLAYTPFGELYAQSGSTGVTNISFARNNEDTVTNLYDAQFREYGIQGHWPSPDPAGLAAVDPANPQSWNRYAYVMNSPEDFVDPLGLCGGTGEFPDLPCPDVTSVTVYADSSDNSFGIDVTGTGDVTYFLILAEHRVGGGGSSSGSTTWLPQAPLQKQPLLVCAANTANQWSIANAIGTNGKTGFWNSAANGLFGNTISTVVSYAYGGSNVEAGTTAYDLGTHATEGSINAVTGAAPITDLGLGAESASQIAEGVATEGLGGIVTAGKLIYDIGSFGYAAYKCR